LQKWEALKTDQEAFARQSEEETKKVERLKQEASEEFVKAKNQRAEMQKKELRLEEERKTTRLEKDSQASKHKGDLERIRSQEMTKLMVGSSVCFVIGLIVAMYFR